VVCLHDSTLDRTTSGQGAVADHALAEVVRLRLKTAAGALTDEPPPTLAALLDLLAPGRASLLIEIKPDAGGRRYPGIEEKALALVRARGLAPRVRVMASDPETIRRLRELDPAVRTVLLVRSERVERERATAADVVGWAREAGAADLGIDHRALDAEVAAAARAAGLGVAAWTVNEERDIRRVIDLGVDVVITDRPDLGLRLTGR
jgi:glycerophosphoryl diester phosphodiesterase